METQLASILMGSTIYLFENKQLIYSKAGVEEGTFRDLLNKRIV
jgi:hypothetical protein